MQSIATIPARRYRLGLKLGTFESTPVVSGPVSGVVAGDGLSLGALAFHPTGVGNQWAALSTDLLAGSNTTVVSIAGAAAAGGACIGLDEVSVVPAPPELTSVPAGANQVRLSWPSNPGFMLQESPGLLPADWTNSSSGATNPIVVSATAPTRLDRLFKP